jgi:hypothetical protein
VEVLEFIIGLEAPGNKSKEVQLELLLHQQAHGLSIMEEVSINGLEMVGAKNLDVLTTLEQVQMDPSGLLVVTILVEVLGSTNGMGMAGIELQEEQPI